MSEPPSRLPSPVPLLTAIVLGLAALYAFYYYRVYLPPLQRAENERSAAGAIKRLTSAQADFRGNDRDQNGIQDFWTGDVAELFRLGLIERGVADADATSERPAVAYRGYYFVAMEWDDSETPPVSLRQGPGKNRHPTNFAFCAYPAEYGVTGKNTFIVNQHNTVRWRHTNGEPVKRWPSDQDLRHEWALGD
jgi:hypothetical protein